MFITSKGIINGKIQDRFGGRGRLFNENGVPSCSLPFRIEEAPEETVSFAIVLEDKDAQPVTKGFTWIHWLAANITRSELFENESRTADDFVQGNNSWTSIQGNGQSKELSCYYGGMTPPDREHMYELHVFALDQMLELERGFFLNDLYRAMKGHVLEEAVLYGVYDKM
ncbi:MAG: YbhB/YbcL family Raf kinase inhibitor-like protein [Anaerostipes sp.]|nr:YbhB/YbcL family Raf kinase inhibitor-like protein [Anaerostipes sp.]MBS7008627.1 YbhB/YbcL family Raf kinase inhibitor-like protein [Anaerostipes sp.]